MSGSPTPPTPADERGRDGDTGAPSTVRHDTPTAATNHPLPDASRSESSTDASSASPSTPLSADHSYSIPTSGLSLTSTAQHTRVGRYPVLRVLGRGGMGIVYEAEDPRLKRRVALKMLTASLADAGRWRQQFEREAQLLAAVQHPSIAVIYSIEDHEDGQGFITMELVEGESLEERLGRGQLDLPTTLAIGRQIAVAVATAHANGVVHRDLKPGNVMITPRSLVKVLDFGLARSASVAAGSDLIGNAVGTAGYASPEQQRGESSDSEADVWALGCILFECLTGQRAFAGADRRERAAAVLQRAPDWHLLPDSTPPELVRLLESMLAKEPAARPDSMAAVRQRLERIAVRPTVRAQPVEELESWLPKSNLPVRMSTFIGRAAELEDLQAQLSAKRLLTLTGTGGTGKSRLALEFARRVSDAFPGGTWLVELSSVADPALVPRVVAEALGLAEGQSDPQRELERTLGAAPALLLLDNCEHLLGACGTLACALLENCPPLRILCTSREPLSVEGEALFAVSPLERPDLAQTGQAQPGQLEDLERIDSVALFVDRVRMAKPSFQLSIDNASAVVEVCCRLDGIPLALELAAARARTLGVAELARRIDDRFRLLGGGQRTRIPRHRTLRSLIDWSHDQLHDNERTLFRRLAVFSDGCRLESAEAVCAGLAGDDIEEWEVLDVLGQLVDKSLVETVTLGRGNDERVRYRMLETIRQYAQDRLIESDEITTVAHRHAEHFLALAEECEPQLRGADRVAFERLLEDDTNLQVAIRSAATQAAMQIVGAIRTYWLLRGFWSEGRRACAELLDRSDADEFPAARAKLLNCAGLLAMWQGDLQVACDLLEESLTLHRRLDDAAGTAGVLNNLGTAVARTGDLERASELNQAAFDIHHDRGDQGGMGRASMWLGLIDEERGELDQAAAHFRKGRELFEQAGHEALSANMDLHVGDIARRQDDLDEAGRLYRRALERLTELGVDGDIARALERCGQLATATGDFAGARDYLSRCIAAHLVLEGRGKCQPSAVAAAVTAIARLAAMAGDHVGACRLMGWLAARRDEGRLAAPAVAKLDEIMRDVAGSIDERERDRAVNEGQALTLEEIVSYSKRLGVERAPEGAHDARTARP